MKILNILGLCFLSLLLGCESLLSPKAADNQLKVLTSDEVAQSIAREDTLFSLQSQIDALNENQQKLQDRIISLETSIKPSNEASTSFDYGVSSEKSSVLAQAKYAFSLQRYQDVLTLLRPQMSLAKTAQESQQLYWLLIQTHARLKQCESVISSSNAFVSRYPDHPNAPNALWLVAKCQTALQQKDIARETLSRIERQYPQSAAANLSRQKRLQ